MSIRNNSVIDRWEREVSKPLGPSEYGGYSGEVQPPPHEMTADERARMQRRIPAAGKDSDLKPRWYWWLLAAWDVLRVLCRRGAWRRND
jgi:hypothetical protein